MKQIILIKCKYIECEIKVDTSKRKYCSSTCSENQRKLNRKTSGKIYTKPCASTVCPNTFDSKDLRQKYCSMSCAAVVNNTSTPKRKIAMSPECARSGCLNTIGRSKSGYCSNTCRKQGTLDMWLCGTISGNGKYTIRSFVREYVLKRAAGACEGIDSRTNLPCTETRVFQVDHISGDSTDSTPGNLRALCPTCHTLTETFGARNKGNGRAWKAKYSQFELIDTND